MADNGNSQFDEAQSDAQQVKDTVNDAKNTINTGKNAINKAKQIKQGMEAAKAGANAASAAGAAGSAAGAGAVGSGAAAATASGAASAGAATAGGAAAGPAGIAAAAAIALGKTAVKDPVKAGMIIMIPLVVIFFPLFVIFSLLSWLNPFSTTNSVAGDNEEAQAKDIEKDKGKVDDDTALMYTTDENYDTMAGIIQDKVNDAYEEVKDTYYKNKAQYAKDGDYKTHDDVKSVFILHGGTKYNDKANIGARDTEAKLTGDYKNLEGNTWDDTDYFTDNSNNGAIDGGIAYILAAYSVSKGNTSPQAVISGNGKEYSFYYGLEQLLSKSDVKKGFFEYNDNLSSLPVTTNVKLKTVEQVTHYEREKEPIQGNNYYCQNCSNKEGLGWTNKDIYSESGEHMGTEKYYDNSSCKMKENTEYYYRNKTYSSLSAAKTAYLNYLSESLPGTVKHGYGSEIRSLYPSINAAEIKDSSYYVYSVVGTLLYKKEATRYNDNSSFERKYWTCNHCNQEYRPGETGKVTGHWTSSSYTEVEVTKEETKEFTHYEYSYQGTLSPFNKSDLIERMFLDDNPFYKDIVSISNGSASLPSNVQDLIVAGDSQQSIANIAKAGAGTKPCTPNYCAAWVSGVYEAAGLGYPGGNAIDYWLTFQNGTYKTGSQDFSNIPVGATVVGSGSGSEMGRTYGHVGIYVGGGMVAHNAGKLVICTLNDFANIYCTGTMYKYGYHGLIGWVWPFNTPLKGVETEGPTDNTQNGDFTKYSLTETQLLKLAKLCVQEQGHTVEGAAAEASLMANLFEKQGSKYGTGATGLYNYVRTGGWFANAAKFMDGNVSVKPEILSAVKAVLVEGKRTLPVYVDEHDCFSDIVSATNNGTPIDVTDRSQYKKDVTVLKNRYGSTYTFYCFPTPTADPFGYISKNGSDACYGTTGSSAATRGEALEAIMKSPYYQWGVYYIYDCEHEKSYQTECPKCGAEAKTEKEGFLWWKKVLRQFEYVKADEPDKNWEQEINDDGKMEKKEDVYTVEEKIQYYVDDMLNSIEAASKYEQGGGSNSFGGTGASDIVAFAVSKLNCTIYTSGTYDYWKWGDQWCAMFVSFCAKSCGYLDESAGLNKMGNGQIPKHAYTVAGAQEFQANGVWQYASSGYTPVPGDIIYFDWQGSKTISGIDHVAIVEKCENGVVSYIGGNQGGGGWQNSHVTRGTVDKNGSSVVGYGTPQYPTSSANLSGNSNAEKIWNYLTGTLKYSDAGAAAVMGNWQQESGLIPNNVQNGMGYEDGPYTQGIKSGTITRSSFANDSRGYGLAQWTYHTRKAAMYDFCGKDKIDDLASQLSFYAKEMEAYGSLTGLLKATSNVYDACYQFQAVYERAGKPEMNNRLKFAQSFYSQFH